LKYSSNGVALRMPSRHYAKALRSRRDDTTMPRAEIPS
jgi:hypothetical protein